MAFVATVLTDMSNKKISFLRARVPNRSWLIYDFPCFSNESAGKTGIVSQPNPYPFAAALSQPGLLVLGREASSRQMNGAVSQVPVSTIHKQLTLIEWQAHAL